LKGNPIHLKCAVCGIEFGHDELFKSWDYTNVFALFEKHYPVHFRCANEINIPILEGIAKQDSINNLMDIRQSVFG
jgi:hypothetical protein